MKAKLISSTVVLSCFVAASSAVGAVSDSASYNGTPFYYVYSGDISSTDCLDPARGAGFFGDVYRANSAGTISLYMEEGLTGSNDLSDPYLIIRDSDRETVLKADDDSGGDDNGDDLRRSAFISNFDVQTDDYIIATTYATSQDGNYKLFSSTITLTQITSCPQIITEDTPSTAIYGETVEIEATATSGLTVSVSSSTSSICSLTDSTGPEFALEMVATGTCTITFSQSGDGSNAAAPSVVKNIIVNPKSLTLSGLSADKTYDGNTTASVTGTPSLSQTIVGDDVSLSGTVGAAGTFNSANAGSRTVTTTGLSLSGSDASKYTLLSSIPATIAKLALTGATISSTPSKTYDGTTSISLSADDFTLTGALGDDEVTVNNTSGVLDSPVVGVRTITVETPSLGGADASNYTLASPVTGPGSVTARELTIGGSFSVANKDFDGTKSATISSNSLALSSLVSGETDVQLANLVTEFASSSIASGITVSIVSAELQGTEASNYSLSLTGAPTTTADISAASPGAPTAVEGEPLDETSIVLTWTAPSSNGGSAITGYMIEVDDGSGWTTTVADTGSTDTTHTLTELSSSVAYLFRVSAINSVGMSSASIASVEISTTPPQPLPYAGPVIYEVDETETSKSEASATETATFTGARLGGVTKTTIDGKDCEIVSASSSQFTIVVPAGLAPGTYDLEIESSLGNLTYLDAITITGSVTTETVEYGEMSAWTKRINDTQVKVYVKFPTVGEKVRISHQTGGTGSYETVYVKTTSSETMEGLRIVEGVGTYIVRTIDLEEINRIRVTVGESVEVQVRYDN